MLGIIRQDPETELVPDTRQENQDRDRKDMSLRSTADTTVHSHDSDVVPADFVIQHTCVPLAA